jgi:hypothetical protein
MLRYSSNTQGLENGGLAGMFWSYVWTFIGFGFIIASLSEMASMYGPREFGLLSITDLRQR